MLYIKSVIISDENADQTGSGCKDPGRKLATCTSYTDVGTDVHLECLCPFTSMLICKSVS